jgi:hypothetical protein
MGRDHADDAEPGPVRWLDDGSEESEEVLGDTGRSPNRRWPRWLALLLAGAAAAIVAVAVTHRSKPAASPATRAPTHGSSSSTPSGPSPSSVVPPTSIRVTNLGHPLLGTAAGWELFGRGVGVLVRIQPALGRITRTFVPGLATSGPVSFLATSNEVLIRPLDLVPGYAVPDGQPARELTGRLSRYGPALPGPDPRHVWVAAGAGPLSTMILVGQDGKPTGASIRVPADMNAFPETDDTGGLLLTGTGGTYDARPDGLHRITTGTLLALGPTRWLTRECDSDHHCATVVIDRTTGARHTLADLPGYASAGHGPVAAAGTTPGVISPDGTTAALIDPATARVHLLTLASGADHPLAVRYSRQAAPGETMVWSPDSRWLFITESNGRLAVIDAHTRQLRHLGAPLPQLSQLAIRA